MSAVELFRLSSGFVWLVLLAYLFKPARAAMSGNPDAKPSELIMSAVWLLCLNRFTFTLVGQFASGDPEALTFCHAFALFGGCYMLFMCSLARRRG